MKILDDIISFGEACRKVKLSHDYNVTTKIDAPDREKPYFTWHTEGNFGFKIVKLAASAAIVAGIGAIASKLDKSGK